MTATCKLPKVEETKYFYTKQRILQKFKHYVKETNLETQAQPYFHTPDVKTSCLITAAYISNL